MDSACLCPSPPPNGLTDDKLRPDKHTPRLPAHGCRLVVCSLYVQLVIIESFFSRRAIQTIAQPSLYRTGPPILSRTFSQKTNLRKRVRVGFDNSFDRIVASRFSFRIAINATKLCPYRRCRRLPAPNLGSCHNKLEDENYFPQDIAVVLGNA